jgi:hypothetical protein
MYPFAQIAAAGAFPPPLVRDCRQFFPDGLIFYIRRIHIRMNMNFIWRTFYVS